MFTRIDRIYTALKNSCEKIFLEDGTIDLGSFVGRFVIENRRAIPCAVLADNIEYLNKEIFPKLLDIMKSSCVDEAGELLWELCTAINNQAAFILHMSPYQLHCCIKLFKQDHILTLARSNPVGQRHALDGERFIRDLKLSTAACSLLGEEDCTDCSTIKVDAVSCGNIVKAKHKKVYSNTRTNASMYFKSTFIVPLKLNGKVMGELAFDSPKKSAFLNAPDIAALRCEKITWEEYHQQLSMGECGLFYNYCTMMSNYLISALEMHWKNVYSIKH